MRIYPISILLTLLISSCSLLNRTQNGASPEKAIVLDTIDLAYSIKPDLPLQPSDPLDYDLIHAELDLSFNLQKQSVLGSANLLISPYRQNVGDLVLDARGFDLSQVDIVWQNQTYKADYRYDGRSIRIHPPDHFSPEDSLIVSIRYEAFPSQLENGGGQAITSNQGLYFIDPLMTDSTKPTQIWSQGEPECNSGWFPLIDQPNEKFTQEIFLTVDTSFHTISNGRLLSSTINGDGTRTDYWKQDRPHSGYLTMIALGEFSLVKDRWNDLDVWYYLDEEYIEYADDIFGNTPEMLTFYSELLDYPYPWEKYHQIVVKDFVSGAMENTSAVIHGDFIQQTRRDMIDGTYEDVISHELFHHWFGNLVTCESWSNIALNEGFATYGEYLWKSHKYGANEAKLHLQQDLNAYFSEAESEPKPLFRERYADPDDVFDNHSYQKAGRVLHLLRQEVGDDTFFASLHEYLTSNAYQNVEVEHLRLAFEKVSGRDLRWFFNQWFYREGHPIVSLDYKLSNYSMTVFVQQDQPHPFVFSIPLTVSLSDTIIRTTLPVKNARDSFEIDLGGKSPNWYAADPSGDLVWQFQEQKPEDVWLKQLESNEHFIAQVNAMSHLVQTTASENGMLYELLMLKAEKAPFWYIRYEALSHLSLVINVDTADALSRLSSISKNDVKSHVRALALNLIERLTRKDDEYLAPFIVALQDSSTLVSHTSLSALGEKNPCAAKNALAESKQVGNSRTLVLQSRLHAKCGDPNSLLFYETVTQHLSGLDLFMVVNDFASFAEKCNTEAIYDALVESLKPFISIESSWWGKYSGMEGLKQATDYYSREIFTLESKSSLDAEQTKRLANLRNKKSVLAQEMVELERLLEPSGSLNLRQ